MRPVPGILIFRSSATLYFANAEMYQESLGKKVRTHAHAHTHTHTHTHTHGINVFLRTPPQRAVSYIWTHHDGHRSQHFHEHKNKQATATHTHTHTHRKSNNSPPCHSFRAINSSLTNIISDILITGPTFLQFTHHDRDRHCWICHPTFFSSLFFW